MMTHDFNLVCWGLMPEFLVIPVTDWHGTGTETSGNEDYQEVFKPKDVLT